MSKALSLIQRDAFFDDAFFTESWDDFDTAMKSVLSKFEEKSDFSTRSTCTDVYRKLRTTNVEKDLYASQALQVTEKDGKFQCVMDVKDFNPNELQVKVVDEKVTVEGKFEKKSEDGKSMSSKSFFKEFTLGSCADLDQVSTALSKDGVLTIKAPKREAGAVTAAPSGAVTKSTSSTVEESSSSVVQDGDSSKSTSSAVKKSSFSSTQSSSFSSSTSSSFTSSNTSKVQSNVSSNVIQESSIDDMEKDLNNRLVFTHDTVNVKLPQ